MAVAGHIELRGVEVHNLQGIDLDIPHGKLVVLCGLSGSGKSSLALDTLYAEGQRRYIESFSAYTRQFLERLEKPEADRIDGIPPAIAVTSRNGSRSSRSTVASATETYDYLRLLFAKIGRVVCDGCACEVRRDTPQSAAGYLAGLSPGTRYMVAFESKLSDDVTFDHLVANLREDGFVRAVLQGRTVSLDMPTQLPAEPANADGFHVVVDRLTAGGDETRLRDSLEIAFEKGGGRCQVFVEESQAGSVCFGDAQAERPGLTSVEVDGRQWRLVGFSSRLVCEQCGREFAEPEPRLFSFNHPLGACPACEGFGNVIGVDMDLVVPDPGRSIREGAIAPWKSPAYAHELEELIALAPDYGIPLDVPFSTLDERQLDMIRHGVPERKFGGLDGFFAWLERRKYKMHIRVFLSRWRSYRPCPTCNGARLRPEALAVRVSGQSIAQIAAMKVADARAFFAGLSLADWQRQVGRVMLEQVESRLDYLRQVGLDYLTLDRTIRTLSGGELRRVAMTSALGSSLVNMLYLLDEPSIGLHPRDVHRLLDAVRQLRDRDNTVVVVEHEEAIIRAADEVIEIGPGAGERGGRIVFQGTPEAMLRCETSLTGDYLAGRRGIAAGVNRRIPDHGWIRLAGARGNNLRSITVEFPLGLLCLVTGVSGSGKSTLVQDTLYPALCRRLRKDAPKPLPYDDVFGDGQIDDVIMVDQSPIGRTPRSNPVTYLKAFDEIRAVFAETPEARTRGYPAGHFSFNVDGGRCPACGGDGYVQVDMQFLADVFMKCSECDGRRYRAEILEVTYRGRNIADVLDMTVREAFTFFRGRPKVQARLKRLIDVGLDYVRLGQPANTLSGGEAQRLKLAAYMSSTKRGRCLFILDEPTTGLHFSDVIQLLDCFDALLAVGHSLIVVEHNLQMMKAADYIIDLGPGAADQGGQVVAKGTPELLANCPQSVTGKYLGNGLA
ncbi:MAG: excinuclease ABC subunit UvrA [Thermoguttaceae bacterium]|jgi:excinuclease ABC subunit A|nr:excinuclease ABC subunit UvrA [Thermoguttaceae bacterium]